MDSFLPSFILVAFVWLLLFIVVVVVVVVVIVEPVVGCTRTLPSLCTTTRMD
jgi:hypothetical protein